MLSSGWSLISNFSTLFSKPFGTVLNIPITIGITFNLIFHSVFSSLARFKYLSIFFVVFYFHSVRKSSEHQVLFLFFYLFIYLFIFCLLTLDLVFEPGLVDRFISQNPREFYASHSLGQNIIIILFILEFFTSTLADGFSLESEWQQVSSSPQDSS